MKEYLPCQTPYCNALVAGYICEECGYSPEEYTPLVLKAKVLAMDLHKQQVRKNTGKSYYDEHLLPVSRLVAEACAPAEAIAAALLHDAIEDQGNKTRARILDVCGQEVLALVEECTEPGTGGMTKAPWRERKDAYLEHIASASEYALLISVADKLQSCQELATQVATQGDGAYSIFKAGKSGTLWFHHELLVAFRARIDALPTHTTQVKRLCNIFEMYVEKLV